MGKTKYTKDEVTLMDRGFEHHAHGVWIKDTSVMTDEEWLAERQFGLGGSDIGTILGFNTFKTAVELFREKVGLNDAPKLETRHIYWGHEAEKEILNVGQFYDFSVDPKPGRWSDAWVDNLYTYKNSEGKIDTRLREIIAFPYMCVNKDIPWLQANVDGLVNYDENSGKAAKVAEAKNTQEFVCKQYNDWVNPSYIAQGLTYSKVLQPMLLAPGFEIYQKLDGNDIMARSYTLSDFEWLVDDILNESFEFYNNMVKGVEIVKNAKDKRQAILGLRDVEPGPDDTKRYDKFISQEFKENSTFTTADLEDYEIFEEVDEKGRELAVVGYEDFVDENGNDAQRPRLIPVDAVKNIEKYVHAFTSYDKKVKNYTKKKALFVNTVKKFMSDYGVDEIKFGANGYVRWKSKFTPNYKKEK